MSEMLRNLDKQAILLMYEADELSPEDTAHVEQMLRSDGLLREELELLRGAQLSADTALARLDRLTLPPIPDAVAIRQASRHMKQWQLLRLEAARAEAAMQNERTLRFPWWSYPLATAAAIAMAMIVWRVNIEHNDRYVGPGFVPGQNWVGFPGGGMGGGLGIGSSFSIPDMNEQTETVAAITAVLDESTADTLLTSFDITDDVLEESLSADHLDQAEQELLAIWDRKSDFPDALFIEAQEINP